MMPSHSRFWPRLTVLQAATVAAAAAVRQSAEQGEKSHCFDQCSSPPFLGFMSDVPMDHDAGGNGSADATGGEPLRRTQERRPLLQPVSQLVAAAAAMAELPVSATLSMPADVFTPPQNPEVVRSLSERSRSSRRARVGPSPEEFNVY